ncbi:quinone oxidoreductase family protein [Zavarzinia sp. CC-PAN008]|uniref:quinone oxidoreductase family protein n=1 Tax=Zavarzinia sp. CC-PAN008 TaxID=3243332 RepID=UPI003F749BCD
MAAPVRSRAVRFTQVGGPEVMRLEEVDVPAPGPGQVRLKHTAIGVNYIDTYHRSGLYKLPLPSGIGVEGAGVVEAVGDGVTELAVGDRVAYCGGMPGGYSDIRLFQADRLLKIPEGISDETAAAAMLQGLTVHYLLFSTYPVKRGETILFHAAAGGVGLIACQWARHLGVRLIGTVGSKDKGELARAHGASEIILYREEDVAARVKDLTGGKGVPVVYDAVGKDTFEGSLNSLSPRGYFVSFGNASGPVAPFAPSILGDKGSLFFTRPGLFHYVADTAELQARAADLFDVLKRGIVEVPVRQRFALADAVAAHQALEGRQTTGSTILVP